MKKYIFEVTVFEGNDEFWEEVTADGKSGCDAVLDMLKTEMWQGGLDESNCTVKLVSYVAGKD